MEIAREQDVAGMLAICGGGCACGTCHVYVDDAWTERTEVAGPMEMEVLELVPERRPTSRLSCQIKVTPRLDGLSTVRIARMLLRRPVLGRPRHAPLLSGGSSVCKSRGALILLADPSESPDRNDANHSTISGRVACERTVWKRFHGRQTLKGCENNPGSIKVSRSEER